MTKEEARLIALIVEQWEHKSCCEINAWRPEFQTPDWTKPHRLPYQIIAEILNLAPTRPILLRTKELVSKYVVNSRHREKRLLKMAEAPISKKRKRGKRLRVFFCKQGLCRREWSTCPPCADNTNISCDTLMRPVRHLFPDHAQTVATTPRQLVIQFMKEKLTLRQATLYKPDEIVNTLQPAFDDEHMALRLLLNRGVDKRDVYDAFIGWIATSPLGTAPPKYSKTELKRALYNIMPNLQHVYVFNYLHHDYYINVSFLAKVPMRIKYMLNRLGYDNANVIVKTRWAELYFQRRPFVLLLPTLSKVGKTNVENTGGVDAASVPNSLSKSLPLNDLELAAPFVLKRGRVIQKKANKKSPCNAKPLPLGLPTSTEVGKTSAKNTGVMNATSVPQSIPLEVYDIDPPTTIKQDPEVELVLHKTKEVHVKSQK